MGLRESLIGRHVYFDANIIVYIVEAPPAMRSMAKTIRELIVGKEILPCTSELTLCEVLSKPLHSGDVRSVELYRSLLEDSGAFALMPTTRAIYFIAARYRGEFGLKTPDAIHVATAVEASCSVFFTNDARIRFPPGIERVGPL